MLNDYSLGWNEKQEIIKHTQYVIMGDTESSTSTQYNEYLPTSKSELKRVENLRYWCNMITTYMLNLHLDETKMNDIKKEIKVFVKHIEEMYKKKEYNSSEERYDKDGDNIKEGYGKNKEYLRTMKNVSQMIDFTQFLNNLYLLYRSNDVNLSW